MKHSILTYCTLAFFFVGTVVPAGISTAIPVPPPLPPTQQSPDTLLPLTAEIRHFFESIISNSALKHVMPQITSFVRYVQTHDCTHFSPEPNIQNHVRVTLFNNETKLRFFMIPANEWNHFVQLANQFEEKNNPPKKPDSPALPSEPSTPPEKKEFSKKSETEPEKLAQEKEKQEETLKKEEDEKKKKEKEEKEKQPVRYVPQPQHQQPQQPAALPSHWQKGKQHYPFYDYGQPQQPFHPHPQAPQQPRPQGFVPDKIGFEGLFRGDQQKTAKTPDATPAEIEALKARGAVNVALPYTDYDEDVEIPVIAPEHYTFEHERRSERRSELKTNSAKAHIQDTLSTKDSIAVTTQAAQQSTSEQKTSWFDHFYSRCSSWWSSFVTKIQSLFH